MANLKDIKNRIQSVESTNSQVQGQPTIEETKQKENLSSGNAVKNMHFIQPIIIKDLQEPNTQISNITNISASMM